MFQVSSLRESVVPWHHSYTINIGDTRLKITSKSTKLDNHQLAHRNSTLTHSVLQRRHHFHAFSRYPQLVGINVVGGAALLAFVSIRLHGCAAILSVQGHAYDRGEVRLSQTKCTQIRTPMLYQSHLKIGWNLSHTTAVRMMQMFLVTVRKCSKVPGFIVQKCLIS